MRSPAFAAFSLPGRQFDKAGNMAMMALMSPISTITPKRDYRRQAG